MLSLKTVELLTAEVRAEIIQVCAAFPWWGIEPVYTYLRPQGQVISRSQVRQAVEESGWGQLRQALQNRYHLSAHSFRRRAGWLVGQLVGLVETLLGRLEAAEGLTPQEQMNLTEVQPLVVEAGLSLDWPVAVTQNDVPN